MEQMHTEFEDIQKHYLKIVKMIREHQNPEIIAKELFLQVPELDSIPSSAREKVNWVYIKEISRLV